MQVFIIIGLIIFAALFVAMSLPIYDDTNRVEPDIKRQESPME